MKFRNYCVVVMGNTQNVFFEIEKVSDTTPNVLDGGGIVVATFSSAIEVKELSEWFKLNNRNFLVFELDDKTSGFHIFKEDIHKKLFGFLNEINDEILKKRTNDLIDAIEDAKIIQEKSKRNKDKGVNVKTVIRPKRYTEVEIENMTIREKEEIINNIIDKGVENMTEYDKILLPLLAKK